MEPQTTSHKTVRGDVRWLTGTGVGPALFDKRISDAAERVLVFDQADFVDALRGHAGHVGLYIITHENTIELRCCARTHGGTDILLLAAPLQ